MYPVEKTEEDSPSDTFVLFLIHVQGQSPVLIFKRKSFLCVDLQSSFNEKRWHHTSVIITTAPNTIEEAGCLLFITGGTSLGFSVSNLINHEFLFINKDPDITSMVLQVTRQLGLLSRRIAVVYTVRMFFLPSGVRLHTKIKSDSIYDGLSAHISQLHH